MKNSEKQAIQKQTPPAGYFRMLHHLQRTVKEGFRASAHNIKSLIEKTSSLLKRRTGVTFLIKRT